MAIKCVTSGHRIGGREGRYKIQEILKDNNCGRARAGRLARRWCWKAFLREVKTEATGRKSTRQDQPSSKSKHLIRFRSPLPKKSPILPRYVHNLPYLSSMNHFLSATESAQLLPDLYIITP